MIKTVVFDIGCVLIGFPWDEYVESLFESVRVRNIVTSCAFECPLWKEMDRGEIDYDQILEKMIEQSPCHEAQIREALDRVGECTTKMDYAIPWIDDLKERGYQVLYLSNYSEYVKSKSMHALDFLEHMDGGIFSCDVKSIKPEDKIFWELIKKYKLNSWECVFIDDIQANLDTADKFGMKTILFDNFLQASSDLEKILKSC